jgi:hypothetical protein
MVFDNPLTSSTWPRPRVLDVLALIWHYYQQDGHEDGGNLQAVLEEQRLEPEALQSCREQAELAGDELGLQILDLLAAMAESSRHRVIDYAQAIDRDETSDRRRHGHLSARPKPVDPGATDHLPLDAELF